MSATLSAGIVVAICDLREEQRQRQLLAQQRAANRVSLGNLALSERYAAKRTAILQKALLASRSEQLAV